MVSDIVQPFLKEPWLTYTYTAPSRYAIETGLPETLQRAKDYPLKPGIFLDYIDDHTPDGVVREDLVVPACHNGEKDLPGGQNIFFYRDASPKLPDDRRVVYYVHGGGFLRGNGPYTRATALWLLRSTGLPVFGAEYRTAPEHMWPDNLDDVDAGWRYLTETRQIAPEDIIVVGDSAGGTLTGGLGMRLKRLGQPYAGAIVWLSPALDLTFELPSHQANKETDPLFYGGVPKESVSVWADIQQVGNPELSAFQGDFTGWPPTYIVAGEAEVFLSDSLEVGRKLAQAGVRVRVHVFAGMWHDWTTNDYEIPESYVLAEDIRQFVGLSLSPRA